MTQGELPSAWRRLFQVELPLVLGTLAYWVLAPGSYLSGVLAVAAPESGVRYLLELYAGSVGSLVLYAYARLLFTQKVHLPSFRIFQEGLLVGDIAVVAVSVQMLAEAIVPSGPAAAQLVMALGWGLVRVVFLMRV